MSKYEALGSNLFGFEIFEEVFKTINERIQPETEGMFNSGVVSAEAAVRRLRESYYETVSKALTEAE